MATKKASPAQIAARKLFAERAKSGSFKNKSHAARRAKAKSVARAEKKAGLVARQKNPVVKKRAPAKKNVARPPKHNALPYSVKCGAKTLASFPSEASAVEYATAWANAHKKPVSVHK